jgi:ribosome maturation factor RimP
MGADAHFFLDAGMSTLSERLWRVIEPTASELGLELVDVEWKPAGPVALLRVFVDRPGGVTLEECARLSRRLDPLLDVEDLIPGRYHLQISSPGLDRPLRRPADFARAVGERVRLTLRAMAGRPRVCAGRLRAAGERVEVELDDGQILSLGLEEIEQARREVEF